MWVWGGGWGGSHTVIMVSLEAFIGDAEPANDVMGGVVRKTL